MGIQRSVRIMRTFLLSVVFYDFLEIKKNVIFISLIFAAIALASRFTEAGVCAIITLI